MKILKSVTDALAGRRRAAGGEARPALVIVLRQSPDWKNLTPAAFREQARQYCRMIGRPAEQVNEAVDLWDSTFGISYLETRQAIKDISLANFGEVRDARLVKLEELAASNTGPGIYLFTDDDDWIDPRILSALNAASRPGCRAFVWGSVIFGGFDTAIKFREFDGVCYTNNYGVDHAYLEGRPERIAAVSQHLAAGDGIAKREFCEVREYLTVTNKNPASTLFLERTLRDGASPDILADAMRKYNRRLERLEIPPTLAWAEPYMRQVKDFYARLLKSRK